VPRVGRIQDRGFWWQCSTCASRNYTSYKNKRNDPDRLTLRKYCPKCRQHQPHKEVGINAKA